MNRRLSSVQIEQACVSLLTARRRVGVRDVMRELLVRHGASGSTQRVAAILRELQAEVPVRPLAARSETAGEETMDQLLQRAVERAERSEEIERRHQDFWAEQFARRSQELEARYAANQQELVQRHAERHLAMSQRVAELERRLAQFEAVGGADRGDSGV